MHLTRAMLGTSGLTLATVCAALALLAQGGRFSAQLDALTHLAPLLLAGAVLGGFLAIGGVGATRGVALGVASVGALAAAALIIPEFLRSSGPVALLGGSGQIKVVQLNAWRENSSGARTRMAEWLKAENPDLAIVEEATPALRNLIVARTGWNVAGAGGAVMIFSHKPYLVMRRPFELRSSALNWVNATYDSASGPFEVVATHSAWPTNPGHATQSVTLRDVLSKLPRERMVLAGDFNSTPWSFTRRRDDVALGLIRRDRALATWPAGHAGPWPWPAPFPFLPLDHVYAGPGWATTSVRRGPRLGSDHYPLVVTLAPIAPR